MNRKRIFLLLLIAFLSQAALGQKVKYKDLMVLLNAKQYDQAKPFLKKYLVENDDNPSAYLYMGIIYQEEALKSDVVKQTEQLINNVDSAIFFYNKCLPKLTEKEIKKNDENYLMYTRRDLRTGEFGIKLSDIQLDLETRTKSLYERRDRVIALRKFLKETETHYARANTFYKELQSRYPSRKEVILQSDDELILSLEKLASIFDSTQMSFNNYKITLQALGKTGYNPAIDLLEIKDFKKDGISMAEFTADEVKIWAYADWARKTSEVIRNEIYPLRKEIIKFDSDINKLREKLKKDSIPVSIQELRNHVVFTDLKKWDPDPMPYSLFQMKIAELEFASDQVSEASLKSEANISKKIGLIKEQQLLLKDLDSLSTALYSRDWELDALNYKNFVTNAYGTVSVLKNLIKATQEFAKREAVAKKLELEENISLLKWVFSDADSIPLFMNVPEDSRFKPLLITETHTAGLKIADSVLVGYFYTITPSRTADLKANFPVDEKSITLRDLPLIKSLSLAVGEQFYYLLFFSESKIEGKIPVSIAKVSRVSGFEWSTAIQTELTPVELKFMATSGELSIKTTGLDGNSKMVVIDKMGGRIQ